MSKKPSITLPLLTAEAARSFSPSTDPSGVYGKIDYAVRNAVTNGRDFVDISTIIPQPHSGAWMVQKTRNAQHTGDTTAALNPYCQGINDTLVAAGYSVETSAGSGAARGYIRISWADASVQEEAA